MKIIDVVSFSGSKDKDWLVFKYPSNELVRGTQLIVQEGQLALLVQGGCIETTYKPGTYTLKSKNLPVLKAVVKIPFGKKTPFSTEVFFVNTAMVLDVDWGTPDPVQLIDPKYHVKLRIRAFGKLSLKILEGDAFLRALIGAMNLSELFDVQKIRDFYRGIIVSKVKVLIAKAIINDKTSALEVSTSLETLAQKIQEEMEPDFQSYGLQIKHFCIESINFPDEDFENINKVLESSMEMGLLGSDGYRTKRMFDVYETAAGNQSGIGGLASAAAVGVGVVAGLSKGFGFTSNKGQQCPSCGFPIDESMKFCSNCGFPLEKRVCKCGALLSKDAKFCPNCGLKVVE